MLSLGTVCLLMGYVSEVKAQVGLKGPKVKPGAYHAEGMTVSLRTESLFSSFAGSPDILELSYFLPPLPPRVLTFFSLLGFGAGVKLPVPALKSQVISTMGMNFGTRRYGASRVDFSTEWRHFPLGHDKDKKYDWEKLWLGLGVNVGHRPIHEETFNPLHVGVFLKLGLGWIAFFTELGVLPVLNGNTRNEDGFDDIDPNARAIRYGFVLEF